jgi:hypothetical protein
MLLDILVTVFTVLHNKYTMKTLYNKIMKQILLTRVENGHFRNVDISPATFAMGSIISLH